MNDRLQHAVIILAAGASRRLGTPKQLLMINNETLLNRTLRLALLTSPAQTLLVLGYRADEIYASANHRAVERVDCLDWQTGMSASLRAGVLRVQPNCEGALIMLCDQPNLTAEHLDALHETWVRQPDYAIASGYARSVGSPAIVPRHWFGKINGLQGDQGARELLRSQAQVIRIDAPELVHDIDSPQDFSIFSS